jgi:hypothetical protein
MAQQGAALQTYNLELIKGGYENAIGVQTNRCEYYMKETGTEDRCFVQKCIDFLFVVDSRIFYT